MKLEYISALLISLFVLCISVPNLFAEDSERLSGLVNTHSNQSQVLFIDQKENVRKEVSILRDIQDRYYLGSAGLTKYGVDLISVSEDKLTSRSIRFRTGLSGLSKSAAAGVQLIVSW